MGVDPEREQTWQRYAVSLIAFSLVGMLALYFIQRFQTHLPLNPDGQAAVPPFMSFNNAVSFTTNTDWQSYFPESTASFFTQTVGFTFQNFMSAAVGLSVAVALIRGLARRRSRHDRQLLGGHHPGDDPHPAAGQPSCWRIVFISQGVIDNFHAQQAVAPIDQSLTATPGPTARPRHRSPCPAGRWPRRRRSRSSAPTAAGSSTPTRATRSRTRTGSPTSCRCTSPRRSPSASPSPSAAWSGDKRQGRALFAVMVVFWIVPMVGRHALRDVRATRSSPTAGAEPGGHRQQSGGNMEGKETRFGPAASAMHGSNSTSTTTGSVVSSHDSFTPLGGGIVLFNILLGEYGPGGVGSGPLRPARAGPGRGVHRRASWSGERRSTSARRSGPPT